MTITEYEQTTLVADGRLPLPSKPLAQRWLMVEPSGFGTTVYTYCEENSGCIVEDLMGDTMIEDLRQLMMQERKKWADIKQKAEQAATKRQLEKEAAQNKSLPPLDNGARRCNTERVDDEQPTKKE